MIPPFDIFSVESDGELVWQAMAESLDVARVKVKTLMDVRLVDYVICSQRTGHKMVIKPDGSITGFPGPGPKVDER
jgi:hypothetical protein